MRRKRAHVTIGHTHRLLLAPIALAILGAAHGPAPRQDSPAATPAPPPANSQRAYRIDPAGSSVKARVPFLGIGQRTALFPAVSGTARLSPQRMDRIALDVRIDATQLSASDDLTTRRLKGDRFFDVANHPVVRFQGQSLTMTTPTDGRVTGQLTARGVTLPATLAVRFSMAPLASPPGAIITLDGSTVIDRRAYGMTAFSLIVGRKVKVDLSAALVPL